MLQLPAFNLGVSILLVLSIANVTMDALLIRATRRSAALRDPPLSRYTFVEDDYPPYLPLSSAAKSVALLLEESVRYGLTAPETKLEWAYTGAVVGDSNIRLGPNHRFFNTGFAYQLHCARFLVSAFQQDQPPTSRGDYAHVSRCLNVIRQFVLCSADTTLEPPGVMDRNVSVVRMGGERRCRNWPALYETMEGNWVGWRSFGAVSVV